MKTYALHYFVATFSVGLSLLGQTTSPPAGMKERTGLRNERYCEILVVNRRFLKAEAAVYNTLGLNNCPDDLWAKMDAKKLAKEKSATTVILNGPRYFVMDRNALRSPGGVSDFDGLQARQLAAVEIKDLSKRLPYTENTVDRQTRYVYEAGKYIYELVSPSGTRYIMQSYSHEIDRNLDQDALLRLGSRLKLPKGWKYQATKIDRDFVVATEDSQAHVLQDDLRNSYQRLP